MPQFARYIGIDYSGAVTPESSCKGLRVYLAEGIGDPEQLQPPSAMLSSNASLASSTRSQ